MKNPLARLLMLPAFAATLAAAPAGAKGVTPWSHEPLPDSNARPSEASLYSWMDGQWAPVKKAAYVHDAQGALIRAEAWIAEPVDGGYQGTWSWDFAYGDDQLLTGIRERVRLDSGWQDTVHSPLLIRRVFRTQGGEEADLEQIWRKESLLWTSKSVKTFNGTGKATAITPFRFNGTAWVAMPPTIFTYDADGNLLSEAAEGGYRYVHAYDARGNRISSEYNSWQSGAWEIGSAETMEYDEAGRLISSLVQRRFSAGAGELIPSERRLHTYPGQDMHEASGWGWDGARWIPQSLIRERFDSFGNLIEWIECSLSEGEWVESARKVSTYDARGDLVERTFRNISPAGKTVSGRKENYSYAPAAALPPRIRAGRAKIHPRSGRQGTAVFLIFQGSAVRDLQGRYRNAP